MEIEGTTALVTGANRGIGKAFTEALLERGAAKVYAAARDVATITDPRVVPIQLVVNNAGVGHVGFPLEASLENARTQLETNYLSLIASTQAFAPVLARNGGGALINMLSVVSWIASPRLATYAASKSAAWSFTNAARIELKQQNTQVVGVHVGFVDTDLTAGLEGPKVSAATVADSALDALEAGEPEALVDEVSRAVKAGLSDDQHTLSPQVEQELAATSS